MIKPRLEILHLEVAVDDLEVLFGFVVEIFLELMALMAMVDELDGLLEGDSDEQAEDDGGDVDEEVAPSGGGVVGGMDVEHRCGFLRRRGGGVGHGDGRLRRDGVGFGHSCRVGDKSNGGGGRRLEKKLGVRAKRVELIDGQGSDSLTLFSLEGVEIVVFAFILVFLRDRYTNGSEQLPVPLGSQGE